MLNGFVDWPRESLPRWPLNAVPDPICQTAIYAIENDMNAQPYAQNAGLRVSQSGDIEEDGYCGVQRVET